MKNSLTSLEKAQKLENAILELEKRYPPKQIDFAKSIDFEFDIKEDNLREELKDAEKQMGILASKIDAIKRQKPFVEQRRQMMKDLYNGLVIGYAEVYQDTANAVCVSAKDKTKIPFADFYKATKKHAAYYEKEIEPSFGTALFIIENGFASIINTNFDSTD